MRRDTMPRSRTSRAVTSAGAVGLQAGDEPRRPPTGSKTPAAASTAGPWCAATARPKSNLQPCGQTHRDLEVAHTVGFGLGPAACADVDLDRRQRHRWRGQRRVLALAHGHECIRVHPVVDVHVARMLLGDRALPRVAFAAKCLVVVAHEQPRGGWQREQLLDRLVQGVGAATGEVGARGAVVRHEKRIADKDRVTNLVGHACRGMSRHREGLGLKLADGKLLTVQKEMVELAAVSRELWLQMEDAFENVLHLCDVAPNSDLSAQMLA